MVALDVVLPLSLDAELTGKFDRMGPMNEAKSVKEVKGSTQQADVPRHLIPARLVVCRLRRPVVRSDAVVVGRRLWLPRPSADRFPPGVCVCVCVYVCVRVDLWV